MGPYMALIVPSSSYGIDARLHALSFSMYYRRDHTFDVKTCFQQNRYVFDVMSVICFLYFVELCPRYFQIVRQNHPRSE
jgi:hypothetical protein